MLETDNCSKTANMNIKKLHSLQFLVRTTRGTKTANITKEDVISAAQ